MIPRVQQKELEQSAKDYPVVTVTGPRQSGKSTLVQHTFPEKAYVNLELADVRARAQYDPRGFLAEYPDGAIIDEVQRVPELLSYIQVIVDEADREGMYVLTGSYQLALEEAITQSLAGRTALLKLLPLTIGELAQANVDLDLSDYILQGFFPRLYAKQLNATKFYQYYFQTYVERDVKQLINVKDLATFERFVRLCAGRIGQLLNASSLGNELGVSHHTVKEWLSILEASFIVFQLQPYFENFGKRIIKAPKIYFTDVGLASYLLGIETAEQLQRDPLRGQLVENLVVTELQKHRLNQGLDPNLYFYRDSQKNEIDVVYKVANKLILVEVKSSATFHSDFLKNLKYYKTVIKDRFEHGYVVYAGGSQKQVGEFGLLNFKETARIIG